MLPSREVRAMLRDDRDRANYDWLYEITRSPEIATMTVGMMMSIAAQNPVWNFFQIVQYVRDHLQVVKLETHQA